MNVPYIADNKNGWLTIEGVGDFSVFRTFDCGQCFRFDPACDPTYACEVEGIAFGKYVRLAEKEKGRLYIKASEKDFYETWLVYLSLDRDYIAINEKIKGSLSGKDGEHMLRAASASEGIRILRQDPWEALCSFIVSQNNNIPRIKKIIAAMSEKYGEKIEGGYAFPTPESLRDAGESAIFELRTGFRAKYIYDAACKVSSGELDLLAVKNMAEYADAEGELMRIKGVGPKVAACSLLFGFERLDAFPIDVWIKKVIANRFENGLDPAVFGEYAGIAQQYLFYYERYVSSALGD
ncbi:MAG: DNA glycosylase [Clostridia bacterium]|nr:DNA glycosylase [Clostridia bacterium]